MARALSKRSRIGLISVAAAVVSVSVTALASAAGPISEDSYNRCQAISDDRARLLCFESLTSPHPQTTPSPAAPDDAGNTPDIPPIFGSQLGPSSVPVAGKWRLVRTTDRRAGREGKDIVAIMSTGELSGSDIDFAGLNLRCAGPDLEVLIFLLSPLRPRTRLEIAINGKRFYGSVISPGTAILLPRETSDLARDQWRSLSKLSIEVDDEGTNIHGLISLDGFNTALQTLVETCSTR